MKTTVANGREFESRSQIDFIDIGGSKGGSYISIKEKFNFKSGLAIDIDDQKVQKAIENKTPALLLDATNMSIFNDNACKLISIIHTLEHLPDEITIENVLKESVRIASDTIYIRGPMYYLDYLSNLGFQFYWSHWVGHTCLIEPDTIIDMMEKLGQTKFELKFNHKIENSNHPCIHSINGLIDRHDFDPKVDPPKKLNVEFEKEIYKEFELIFTLN